MYARTSQIQQVIAIPLEDKLVLCLFYLIEFNIQYVFVVKHILFDIKLFT